jgi:hypothetical protein
MGTSTVHRSPQSARWRMVNNSYDNPAIQADRLLAEVFNAAAEQYATGLADAAVLARLDSLLGAIGDTTRDRGLDAAAEASRDAVRAARAQAEQAGSVSFYGDLADRALHVTITRAAQHPEQVSTIGATLRNFLGNLVAGAIDHVVSRDLSAHLGGRRLASAGDAIALRRELTARARSIADDDRLAPALSAAAAAPREEWGRVMARAWEIGATPPRARNR